MFKRIRIFLFAFLLFLSPVGCLSVHADDFSNLRGISHTTSAKRDQVVVYLDKSANYNVIKLSDPYRIVIDLEDTLSFGGHRKIDVKSKLIDSVRFAQFEPYTARVVIDLKDAYRFEVTSNTRNIVVHVYDERGDGFPKAGGNGESGNTEKQPDEQDKQDPGLSDRSDYDRQEDNALDIQYDLSSSEDRIEFNIEGQTGYNIMRFTDPESLVVDFEGISVPPGTIDVNGDFVTKISYMTLDEDTSRAVIGLSGQHSYRYREEDGKLVLTVSELSYNNLRYHNSGGIAYLEMEGIELFDSKDGHTSYYNCWFDSNRKNMNISFPNNGRDIGNGEMSVNDDYLWSIRVMSGSTTTTVTFMAKDSFKYNIDAITQAGSTRVAVLTPAAITQGGPVVIDAGHGGSEPGAIRGGINEKDLNLDIALRLDKLLKERGVSTYMIREDDRHISHLDRGPIANNLNASLFLSIHNNSTGSRSIKGTETLCYSINRGSGFTGYEFARIVHRHVVETLGTVNRGIIERPNLSVLKSTVMPSVLVEIAYMSNEEDLGLLKQASFRQKAAEALCNAIIETLEEMQRQIK